jgi:hypothetical protein
MLVKLSLAMTIIRTRHMGPFKVSKLHGCGSTNGRSRKAHALKMRLIGERARWTSRALFAKWKPGRCESRVRRRTLIWSVSVGQVTESAPLQMERLILTAAQSIRSISQSG